jgi:hypothetical protein
VEKLMITQDSAKIIETAENIKSEADQFMKDVENFYTTIKSYIGDGEGKAWSGPRATAFLANVEAKRTTFESAKANLDSLAKNLNEQGQAWASFEGGAC